MTDNRAEFIAAEAKVMAGQGELARPKNEVQSLERDGADSEAKKSDLRRLEEELARGSLRYAIRCLEMSPGTNDY